jgi:hypothetical protein
MPVLSENHSVPLSLVSPELWAEEDFNIAFTSAILTTGRNLQTARTR